MPRLDSTTAVTPADPGRHHTSAPCLDIEAVNHPSGTGMKQVTAHAGALVTKITTQYPQHRKLRQPRTHQAKTNKLKATSTALPLKATNSQVMLNHWPPSANRMKAGHRPRFAPIATPHSSHTAAIDRHYAPTCRAPASSSKPSRQVMQQTAHHHVSRPFNRQRQLRPPSNIIRRRPPPP